MSRILAPDTIALLELEKGDWGGAPGVRCTDITGRPLKALVVHHTGSPSRPATRSQAHAANRAVQDFHINTNGWADIAYNKAVLLDQLADGRGRYCQNGANRGNATLGNHNTLSIVLHGNFNDYPPSDIEKNIILDYAEFLDLPIEACPGGCLLVGHRDVSPTECPGSHTAEWLKAGAPRPARPGPELAEPSDKKCCCP